MKQLRLIEISLPEEAAERLLTAIEELKPVTAWRQSLGDDRALIDLLVPSDRAELVFDQLEELELEAESYRAVMLSVDATLPLSKDVDEEKKSKAEKKSEQKSKTSSRISREELLSQLAPGTHISSVYMAMVLFSAIVAAVGLTRGDVAVIIGAMVIAPLLTPNMALALATTLGDLTMVRRALTTNLAGIAVAFALSAGIGLFYPFDPEVDQIANRTEVTLGDVTLALASGAAGAIASTTGVPAALVGVMVAVALLPPLVASGLLLGAGHFTMSANAALLLATNVICVNLAAIVTFLVQGVRPRSWWEADQARKAVWLAVAMWTLLLGALITVILISQQR